MKVIIYALAACLALLGLLFIIAAGQGNVVPRIAIGAVCWLAAAALIMLAQLKPSQQTHVHRQELHLSGDVSLEQMTCRQCGGALSDKSLQVRAGAVFVHCEFCGAQYQIEEAPKW